MPMPDIEWNRRTWDRTHHWAEDGDEWSGMADHCRQPYLDWKQALVEAFLLPHTRGDVLEIAPGHGRFSEYIVGTADRTVLVDLSQSCLDACRARFADHPTVDYVLTDGSTLPGVESSSIDFVWSFDSFVHMERVVIASYLEEIERVLRPGGVFVLHHAGKRHLALPLAAPARHLGAPGRVAYRLASQGRLRDSGRRAEVSRRLVSQMVAERGMRVVDQVQSWGDHGQYDVAKYGDWITTGRKT